MEGLQAGAGDRDAAQIHAPLDQGSPDILSSRIWQLGYYFSVMKADAPAVASSTPIKPSARRMRLHRERRRDGMRCLMVELHDTEVDALVRRGLLKPETRHDRNAVADALYDHLERTLLA